VFSTFLDDGVIISQSDNRIVKFDPNGQLLDVVEFEHHSNQNKGEHYYKGFDSVFYKVYWHDYLCSNDDGINRQVFMSTDEKEKDLEV